MYGNKSKNLNILKKTGFKVPKFISFSENEAINFDTIGLKHPYIIRSSFSIEDGKKNAFAGIFESYFPIYSSEDYQKGYNICLKADESERYKSYTNINKIDTSKMQKHFIIQEFIDGDFSGVCFTKNNSNEIIIEFVPGLNEPLVQGNVKTPFSIVINRNNIMNYEIKNFYMDSTFQTIENERIISKEFDILQFEEDILIFFKEKLLKQFLLIEKLFGYPQDIEFTVQGKDIYILQSRDITTL